MLSALLHSGKKVSHTPLDSGRNRSKSRLLNDTSKVIRAGGVEFAINDTGGSVEAQEVLVARVETEEDGAGEELGIDLVVDVNEGIRGPTVEPFVRDTFGDMTVGTISVVDRTEEG